MTGEVRLDQRRHLLGRRRVAFQALLGDAGLPVGGREPGGEIGRDLSITGFGVFAGTTMPYQPLMPKLGRPASANVCPFGKPRAVCLPTRLPLLPRGATAA